MASKTQMLCGILSVLVSNFDSRDEENEEMPDEGFDEDGGRPADLDANSPVPNKCEDTADGVEQFVCQGCRSFS